MSIKATMYGLDPNEPTRKLVGYDTINPPGNEESGVNYLAQILDAAGFDVKLQRFGERRHNLVAKLAGSRSRVDRLLEAVELYRDILTDWIER